jgi:hypothetical protein
MEIQTGKTFRRCYRQLNKMPNRAINNITPNDAFKEKNHRTIYDINYEKS